MGVSNSIPGGCGTGGVEQFDLRWVWQMGVSIAHDPR